MADIMSWEKDPVLICDNDSCGFMTGDVKEAMAHAYETAHSISGPGVLEGTTLTVSLVRDEEEVEDDMVLRQQQAFSMLRDAAAVPPTVDPRDE